MLIIGVTGSLGAGKSRVAQAVAESAGAPLYDADAVVHALYAPGGAAAAAVLARFPAAADAEGGVDRRRLGACLRADGRAFADLEAIVHPLVARERAAFLAAQRAAGARAAVLDIPLLLEGSESGKGGVDILVVVDAGEAVRRRRLRRRSGMDDDRFDLLAARQMPVAEKRRRADFVIQNDGDWARTRARLDALAAGWARRAGAPQPPREEQ